MKNWQTFFGQTGQAPRPAQLAPDHCADPQAHPGKGDDLVITDRDQVALVPGGLECDVVHLIELCEGHQTESGNDIAALFQGPFMDGFYSGSTIFDDWAAATRRRIETVAIPTLHEAARACPPEKGLTLLLKLHDIDPTREATYLLGMELYAARRQRDQALRLFESLKAMLTREYGVGPSLESERIRQRILDSLPFERSESAAILGARGGEMTVRVRPFENLSATASLDAFLRGLLEATVIELSRINEINVLQEGQPSEPADVVLTGSLLADGSQMQLIMRVTDGTTGRHLSANGSASRWTIRCRSWKTSRNASRWRPGSNACTTAGNCAT